MEDPQTVFVAYAIPIAAARDIAFSAPPMGINRTLWGVINSLVTIYCPHWHCCQRQYQNDSQQNSQCLFHSNRHLFQHSFRSFVAKINNYKKVFLRTIKPTRNQLINRIKSLRWSITEFTRLNWGSDSIKQKIITIMSRSNDQNCIWSWKLSI